MSASQPFRWIRCNSCGWEREWVAAVNQCPSCLSGVLNIISDIDGELPKSEALRQLRDSRLLASRTNGFLASTENVQGYQSMAERLGKIR